VEDFRHAVTPDNKINEITNRSAIVDILRVISIRLTPFGLGPGPCHEQTHEQENNRGRKQAVTAKCVE